MNHKEFVLHPTICSLPWVGVYVETNGLVKNCAIIKESLGNLHESSLTECLHGNVNSQIKQDMLDKISHPRCNVCHNVENLAGNKAFNKSNRSWYKKYGVDDMSLYDNTTNFNLRVLDLRWRNTCNQACVYCGPDLSSRWAQELEDHRWTIEDSVLHESKRYIFDRLDQIKHVYLAGGEPLLMKENQELLAKLITINPDVEIRVNTNLSTLDTEVFRLLKNFNNVKWTVSVDAIESQYDYIRWHGNWDQFFKNLKELQGITQNINFNMVWCALNSVGIFDLVDLLDANGFQENMYIVQCLTSPAPLDVRVLPESQISNLKELISKKLETADSSQWFAKSLNSMYNFLNSSSSATLDDLKIFLKTLDQRRHADSQKIFTHIYDSN